METLVSTPISLELDCGFVSCEDFGSPLLLQLRRGYEECSVLPVPASVDDWRAEHRTARKRANHARNLGYTFREIERERHAGEIYEINTSCPERQGRPMSSSYRERPEFFALPEFPCPRHRVSTYGVFDCDGILVAYLWLYRSGELALVSTILGHDAHLRFDVMYALFEGVVDRESAEPGFFVYNRHDSGTDGLRYFKSKLGFERTGVEWRL